MSCDALESCRIRRVIALGCKAHHRDHFLYMELHISDSANAKIGRVLRPAADFIARGLATGESVLVHCKAGISRSATVILGYLLFHRRDLAPTLPAALALLREVRPCANPRPEFMLALEQLEAYLDLEAWSTPSSKMDERMTADAAAVVHVQRWWRQCLAQRRVTEPTGTAWC